jgi:hypothetical protein
VALVPARYHEGSARNARIIFANTGVVIRRLGGAHDAFPKALATSAVVTERFPWICRFRNNQPGGSSPCSPRQSPQNLQRSRYLTESVSSSRISAFQHETHRPSGVHPCRV